MSKITFQLADYLDAAAEITPRHPCFSFPDGSERSFATTQLRVYRLANALIREGITKGSRVAFLSIDTASYVESLFACTMIGAAFVPLNNRLRANEVLTLLQAAEPHALFYCQRYADLVNSIAARVPSLRLRISFDDDPREPEYEKLLGSGDTVRPGIAVADDDIAAIAFTSGTTGLPKAAVQSQRAIKTTSHHAVTNFELEYEACGYSSSPMFHVAGYGFMFANLVSRSSSFIMPQFDTANVLRALGRGNIRHCLLVPTMITMLLEHPDCATTSFEGLRTILYGAAPIAPTLLRRAMDRFGCKFVQLFGAATETGTQTVLTSRDHREALQGKEHLLQSVGRPGLSVRLRIVDPQGNDLPDGSIGEIITRSDQTMIGYLNRPDATAGAIRNGWFWGGDLGRKDADGYVYLAGRSKDMIIRGGENIYPLEIETVLSRFTGITHVAVIGEPDEKWGEIVVACIIVNDTFRGVDAAMHYCREQLASYKVPARMEVLQQMPLTGSGKISKPALRAAGHEGRRSAYGTAVQSS